MEQKGQEGLLDPILRWLRLQQVLRCIPVGAKLLDVGCGRSAALLNTVAPRIEQGIGVDFKVEPSTVKNIQTLQLKLFDHLPFADASFDVVTLLAVLEHLDNEQQILKEIYRVLKPNGQLVLTVPSVWSQPVLEFLSYRLKIIDEREIRDHKRYYTRNKLRVSLTKQIPFTNFRHYYFQCWMNNFCTVTKPATTQPAPLPQATPSRF